jgi:hypothetical protein
MRDHPRISPTLSIESEPCGRRDGYNVAKLIARGVLSYLAFAAAIAAIDATAPTYAAKIPVFIHQRLKGGVARNKGHFNVCRAHEPRRQEDAARGPLGPTAGPALACAAAASDRAPAALARENAKAVMGA